MRIRWKDQFTEDIERIQARLRNPGPFKKAFRKAIRMLEEGKDITGPFHGHRLMNEGEGWYYCYIYDDIVMIYKVQGHYVRLSRIEAAGKLEKER